MTKTDEFKCNSIGRFAHRNSCEKYYFCWDISGVYATFDCPNKQAFDPVTQLCVYNYAVCALAPKCTLDKRILPNQNDNSTYFVCKLRHLSRQFVLRKQNCADGREFDTNVGYCVSKFLDDDISTDSNDSSETIECEKPGTFIDCHYSNGPTCYECKVKSVSNGTFKLIRQKCVYHSLNMVKSDSVSAKCACICFKLQLLSVFLHIMINRDLFFMHI